MTGTTGITTGHGVTRAGGGTSGGAGRATGLALDLGTARTRLLLSGSPVIRERPSAVGAPAAPRHWPVRHGMVSDMPGCSRLVRAALREAAGQEPLERVLLGVPVAASRLDRRAAQAAVGSAARCPVTIVEEPLAAAVGCGVDIGDRRPRLLLDAGAGIAEAVVIRGGRIADAGAVQMGTRDRSKDRAEDPAGDSPDGPRFPPYVRERIVAMVADLVARVPARMRGVARGRGLLITGGGARDPELARALCAGLRITVTPAVDPAQATVRGLACLLPAVARRAALIPADEVKDLDDDHQ
ncbi:rod shape-determining protein [Microbispora sp. H10670]|uniref:rod shape-determining protein n=1 Tax=Microbispora sp. H10670 TaxID=2729108 RepID=UPI0015FFFDD3|nr:rod shape-determining protein [Microbispora sp. H10670]